MLEVDEALAIRAALPFAEWRALRTLAGFDDGLPDGAALNAACEALKGRGLVTAQPYTVTPLGRAVLDCLRGSGK